MNMENIVLREWEWDTRVYIRVLGWVYVMDIVNVKIYLQNKSKNVCEIKIGNDLFLQ